MATVRFGDFEWDDAKAAANLRKHAVLEEHGRIRIISARRASPAQRKAFYAE